MPELSNYHKAVAKWLIIVLVVTALAVTGIKYPEPDDIPPFPGPVDAIVPLGTTNLSDLSLSGTLGVDGASTLTGNTDVGGTLNYGTNNLYPVGYASSGQQLVYGTSLVTGTLAVSHGLTTVTFCLATLGEDPTAAGTTAAYVTTLVSSNTCTVKVWQDDMVTASDETNVDVHWLVVGAP
jgi:hypothetical protein